MDNERIDSELFEVDRAKTYYDLGRKVVQENRKRERRPAEKRDMVFAVLCLAVSVVCAYLLFWSGVGIGISIVSLAVAVLTALYVCRETKRVSAYTWICAVLYVVLGAGLTFSDVGLAKFLSIIMMCVLYTVMLLDIRGLRIYEAGTYRSFMDGAFCAFQLPFSVFGDTCHTLTHEKDGEKLRMRKAGSVLLGILFAIPAMCVIIPLLISSDAAFEALLSGFTFDNVWEIVFAVLFGALAFILWFGQLFYSKWEKREASGTKKEGTVESALLISFLSVISLAYLVYLVSQTAYFWGGFAGILPEDFTAADYARRGFFEMCAVCALNLIFVFGVWVIGKRENGKVNTVVRILCTFLCAFSMLLNVTGLSKMVMYISRFGLTRLRIYTSVFMVLLFVVFAAVIVRICAKKLPYMKIALVTAAFLCAVMSFMEIDGTVARYNTEAYLSGKEESVDTNSLDALSSDAVVPYLFRLLDDGKYAYEVKIILSDRADMHFETVCDEDADKWYISDSSYDFGRYNVYEYKAHKMLKERFSEYYIDSLTRHEMKYSGRPTIEP